MSRNDLTASSTLSLDGDSLGTWADFCASNTYSSQELVEIAAALRDRGSWGHYGIGNAFAEYIITLD